MPGSIEDEYDYSEEEEEEIPDEELIADLLEDAPVVENKLDCIVAVDNCPIIPRDKMGKLLSVIKKTFGKVGKVVDPIHMPFNASDGKTKGFCFVEFTNPDEARRAVQQINGFKLDKSHVFEVVRMADMDKYEAVPEEFVPPSKEDKVDFIDKEWWLHDEKCRDQFVIRHDVNTSVFWNGKDEGELQHTQANWTESYVYWSPLGSYLATVHPRGIQVWGGPKFSKVQRFMHPNVKLMMISPQENYLVTWSSVDVADPTGPFNIAIWDLRRGRMIRSFPLPNGLNTWPYFKWNHDDSYCACLGEDKIMVYELPSMKLLDKKSIAIDSVRDFAWSPSENKIAYWTPEIRDQPARVTILELPSRKIVKTKNLFNVAACNIHWQNKGDYLAVKIDRQSKTGKSKFTTFELFRMREKDIPVEPLEIQIAVRAFSWEPCGSRFALIQGDPGSLSVSFYDLKKNDKVVLLNTLEKKNVNNMFWSPKGRYVVLAGLGNQGIFNGQLEFWDVNDMVCMNVSEHFMATHVEWDPTGRYVATYVSAWKFQLETGFHLWSFQGKNLQRNNIDKFYQLLWRPRPPTLLSEQELRDLKKKGVKNYSQKFDAEDLQRGDKASKEVMDRRRAQYEEFQIYLKKKEEQLAEHKERLAALHPEPEATDEELIEESETFELFVSEVVEVVE
ncbi:hypothetical protein SARC_06821 [Sphaeroforma arctica JP610]|uniref:Eukaryotic translation initiation factor 3 subunit B n=1 Tax=Sphaeroforma arctica JP610 TaxID=667725 RepID=A0A0L0FVG2_9EUKA|nr:hypothetical protein SARC_06821 [Sphaeroforma arctica JP610]KNC80840.1 hypothetical protein SARC_06821 [Sphaeroforma arctica JP610]|eukprot:XP_014154742.1 hypothetical protein SARC_06821 [Sphaeroforma arctica JP610]